MADQQFVIGKDCLLAFSNPALVRALSKKSSSIVSCPILACRTFKSTAGSTVVTAPNTSAARSPSWRFHSIIWLGCPSNYCANSISLLSPASATFALNTNEWVRLVLFAISCFIFCHFGQYSQQVIQLKNCSNFSDHFYSHHESEILPLPSQPQLLLSPSRTHLSVSWFIQTHTLAL